MSKLIVIINLIFSLNLLSYPLYIIDKEHKDLDFRVDDKKEAFSDKKLGVIEEKGKFTFRLFTPNAEEVSLIIYTRVEDSTGTIVKMVRDENGVWEAASKEAAHGNFYNFIVKHKGKEPVVCLDPYAKAVASFNTYFTPRKGVIIKDNNYNWGKDEWIRRDWRDLIIYETHIKDMTAHSTSGAKLPGTYKGFIEKNTKGGINHIKDLGVNTIELLPSQEYANIEAPYKDSLLGKFNTWNPYERNHWGYMTAAFFAPDEFYVTGKMEWNRWSGADAKQVTDFKDMVKAFHKEGIAVIMDVVYNHISEYEFGNLKEIDKEYYFRLNEDGGFRAESGCGNDLKTEAPMMRRMIVESIIYWMKEYHIDGFRFDLGKLLDWETIEEVIHEAQKVNPNVVIVCEPWGGGYDPAGFSLRGWGSWNDQIRNGIKGENPNDGHGWIFGKWYGNNDPGRIKSYVNGTLVQDKFGLFQKKEHAVNYLESHDGYTFGDFIRIGTKSVKPDEVINDVDKNALLDAKQLKLNKLGALFLFTSQGITMIHEGQEFARSKVLPLDIKEPDTLKGRIDHNTYDKDNEVNYINYKHVEMNSDLVDYYKGLIDLRKKHEAFRRAKYEDIKFFDFIGNEFALGYTLNHKKDEYIVLFNANPDKVEEYSLPSGKWEVLADADKAAAKSLRKVEGKLELKSQTGLVLKKAK